MDMTTTTVPKSDQINAEDVMMSGPVTVTVESVDEGGAEQPVNVHLVEYPRRAYRPSKSMRRVMVKAWGKESDGYTGHRMTLYYDPDVKFGGVKVGGIKISAVSHITKRLEMALTETKGKRALHTVDPLPDEAPTTRPTKAAPAEPPADSPTPEQMHALGESFAEAHITAGADKARYIAGVIGREMSGWSDLSAADVEAITAALRASVDAPPADPWAADAAAVAARDEQVTP